MQIRQEETGRQIFEVRKKPIRQNRLRIDLNSEEEAVRNMFKYVSLQIVAFFDSFITELLRLRRLKLISVSLPIIPVPGRSFSHMRIYRTRKVLLSLTRTTWKLHLRAPE